MIPVAPRWEGAARLQPFDGIGDDYLQPRFRVRAQAGGGERFFQNRHGLLYGQRFGDGQQLIFFARAAPSASLGLPPKESSQRV